MSIKLLKNKRQEKSDESRNASGPHSQRQAECLGRGVAEPSAEVGQNCAVNTSNLNNNDNNQPLITSTNIKPTPMMTAIQTTITHAQGHQSNARPSSNGILKLKQLSDGVDNQSTHMEGDDDHYEAPLVWKNICLFIILHSSIPIALHMLLIRGEPQWKTLLWSILGMYASGLGVTGGAHRLWSHRSYKARAPVQVFLMLLQTMAGQNSIYTWSRDHRVHHKFSETHADPHNIKRGFFFAHMGWLCCRKHPDVKLKGALMDMSDLESNPVVMFQHRHFWWLATVFTVLLPTLVPVWLWQERFWPSFIFSFMIRYLVTLHGTWLVNSAAHYYGSRPYDKHIEARESPLVIFYGLGEGFHNYHHTFPFDYSTSEFGKYFNITTAFIDLCASIGLVHDRRKMDNETIANRQLRTGEQRVIKRQKKRYAAYDPKPTIGPNVNGRIQSNGLTNKAEQLKQADQSPLNMDIIHELPYMSGLTSMKYTM